MSDHATVKLEGKIVDKPKLGWRPEGDPVMTFSIGIRRRVPSEFHVNLWTDYFIVRKVGEDAVKLCKEYSQGDVVIISGYLRQQRHKVPRGERSMVYVEAVMLDRCAVAACS